MARVEVMTLTPAPALDPPGGEARVGLVVLATDATTEADFAALLQCEKARVHVSRIAFENPTTPESLAETAPRLTAAASLLLPGSAFRVIYFACTAASSVIGESGVAAAVAAGKPGALTLTPISAARAALAALAARRISLLAPYSPSVTEEVAATFEGLGFTLDRVTCWNIADDREMARVRPDAIAAAAPAALAPHSDALFISCTALRAAGVAGAIEAAIGRPVVTSNQAAAWACRSLTGQCHAPPSAGRLFQHPFVQAEELLHA